MKLLIAVVTFVIVPFVFAEGSGQMVAPSPQEGSKPPNSQTQGGHEKSADTVPPLKTPTGDPGPGYETTGPGEGNPPPFGKEGNGKEPGVARFSFVISIISAAIALIRLLQTNKTRKITERAYLAAEQWGIEGDYIMCSVANRGRTPATLLSGYTEYTLWANTPSDTPEARRRVDRDFGEADLPAQEAFPLQVGTLSQAEWSGVRDQPTLTLRVEAYIQYRDVFKEVRPMRFAMEYDGRIKKFVIADKRASTKERK